MLYKRKLTSGNKETIKNKIYSNIIVKYFNNFESKV